MPYGQSGWRLWYGDRAEGRSVEWVPQVWERRVARVANNYSDSVGAYHTRRGHTNDEDGLNLCSRTVVRDDTLETHKDLFRSIRRSMFEKSLEQQASVAYKVLGPQNLGCKSLT